MIFNQQGRSEAVDFLDGLYGATKSANDGRSFEHVIFCTNVTYAQAGYKRGTCVLVSYTFPISLILSHRDADLYICDCVFSPDFVNHQYDPEAIAKLTTQHAFAERWSSLDPEAKVSVVPSIEEAINQARALASDLKAGEAVQALVTGSLHLVGGALEILEGADAL